MPARIILMAGLLLAGAALPGRAAPVDSNRAAADNGGGCHPPALSATGFDTFALRNPEWASVIDPLAIDAEPVLLRGTVRDAHGDLGSPFPATHVRGDIVAQVEPDAIDANRLATGNAGRMAVAWEAGALPDWVWASEGDRLTALGRWVFDCGQPAPSPGTCSATTAQACATDADCTSPACSGCTAGETCVGASFGYRTEIHPPHAIAVVRTGRGAIVSAKPGATPVRATRADVFVSADGRGAGDRCLLEPQAAAIDLLGLDCFPLAAPVADVNMKNFEFDLPLPPRPPRGRARWRVIPQPTPGGAGAVRATLLVTPRLRPVPRLRVRVRMRKPVGTMLPTGWAGTIVAGWTRDTTPLTHVRVTVEELIVLNPLQPIHPSVPKECALSGTPCDSLADCAPGEACLGQGPVRSWRMQVAVNGEWRALTGLSSVETSTLYPQTIVYDQYLPADGALRVVAEGAADECREARVGLSLADAVPELGLTKLQQCLDTHTRDPGRLDVVHPGPDFGAGESGSTQYEPTSTGGDGGTCSLTTIVPCVVDDDCPVGEICVATGGAFALRYRVERLP